ncbi:inovirus Gp2 family protein [Ralstonia solanacearum]|nr:inovirus Gp2 family protein [Ralstonia solanacearum]NKF96858.1 inovirus Gp2 family protein [Ralstonia solanacearum]NKG12165.1 inovirus Gp2 family protein [Ralstonia solanacearum]
MARSNSSDHFPHARPPSGGGHSPLHAAQYDCAAFYAGPLVPHSTVNKPNLPITIDQPSLDGGALFADRCLNSALECDGLVLRDGPHFRLLASLDHFIWTSLETKFSPFIVRGEMYSKRVRERDVSGQLSIVSQPTYATAAFPNPSFPSSDRVVTLLSSIKSHLTSHPVAKRLLYPPHLQLLMDAFSDHQISRCTGRGLNDSVDHAGRSMAEAYNDFVDQFRQAMQARKLLRRELHNWYLGSRENLSNVQAYLDDLFNQYPSLTVLHLRLLPAPAPVGEQQDALQVLRESRTKLFDRMRRNPALFTLKPGYVWCFLPSLDGRYDLHLTLLFDTTALLKVLYDKRVEAERVGVVLKDHADLIGTYWVENVTGGQGRYYRPDLNGALYGLGWVHGEVCADDTARREKLKDKLGYLAVLRALVRLNNEPRGEYFGMRERKARASRRPAKGRKNRVPNGEDARAYMPEISIQNP